MTYRTTFWLNSRTWTRSVGNPYACRWPYPMTFYTMLMWYALCVGTLLFLCSSESEYPITMYDYLTSLVPRTCKDIVLPLSEPVTASDGSTMTEIPVPAGTMLLLGSETINRSKDVWGEDALEFKPERWLSLLPSTVTETRIPGVYSHLFVHSFSSTEWRPYWDASQDDFQWWSPVMHVSHKYFLMEYSR